MPSLFSARAMVYDWIPSLARRAGLLRVGRFEEESWFGLRAGVRVGDREIWFPLCAESAGRGFTFLDQRMSPCTSVLIGIDEASVLKVRLTVTTPFRPRDAEFSTTPVLTLQVAGETLPGAFRWSNPTSRPATVELILEIGDWPVQVAEGPEGSVILRGESRAQRTWQEQDAAIVRLDKRWVGGEEAARTRAGFRRVVNPAAGRDAAVLTVAWCGWLPAILEVGGRVAPMLYADRFANVEEVTT
jgi:hypothetical protein